jgi:phosphatidylinositol alpha-1,6-mannosyltransferase
MAHLSARLKQKHSVFVITAYAPDECEDRVLRAPYPGLIAFALYALWRGALLLLRNRKIDVVFGGSVMVTPLVYFLARAFRRKAIVQAHGLDLVYRSLVYQTLCVGWLRYCNAVLANSNYTATLAVERGVSRESIAVIPLGVDVARFVPAANCDELKKALCLQCRQIILFVGRLARRKGVEEFVRNCLPAIVHDLPQVCFVIAGGNPTESLTHRDDVLSEIQAAVRELGLQDHVRSCGEVSDDELVKLYRCCDIVVLPALASTEDVEGFGMVLLEAGAAGKPVIATRVGGIPDAIVSGQSGILIKPGDYRELSNAIVELLGNDNRRQAIGECARRRVQRDFSWETIVPKYEKAFSS